MTVNCAASFFEQQCSISRTSRFVDRQILNENVKPSQIVLDETSSANTDSTAGHDQISNENIVDRLIDPFFSHIDVKVSFVMFP